MFKHLATTISIMAASLMASAQNFATSSVLSEGKWHKVSVEETGMYCLTAQQLSKMGFSDISKVRVYGMGGRQLSLLCGNDMRDDLTMLPTVRVPNGIVFYAEGPNWWNINGASFVPQFNNFSKKAYYYITTGDANDNAAETNIDAEGEALSYNTYTCRMAHALRTTNIDKSGRDWVGEKFTKSSKKEVQMGLEVIEGSKVYLRGRVATYEQTAARKMYVNVDGTKVASANIPLTLSNIITQTAIDFSGTAVAKSTKVGTISFDLPYTADTEAAWVTYLALTSTAELQMSGAMLDFRNTQTSYSTRPIIYSIGNTEANTMVWDVTTPYAPVQMKCTHSGATTSFVTDEMDGLHEYVAFNPEGSLPSPTDEGSVANHNLHAHQSVNYLIVTPRDFESYAERLGTLHHNAQGLSWRAVRVDDIYDEFSAGRPEAPAIRNYIKMIYERGQGSADELKYVLLLGEGSYNNFDQTRAENRIPTYQCPTPYGLVASYCTDDFYGWLENEENYSDVSGTVDVGIGRLPASTTKEAEIMVSKIEQYMLTPQAGEWRGRAMFVGSGGDDNEHVGYAEKQATAFESENPDMETVRVYSEANMRVTTATGYSYPEAVAQYLSTFRNGCLLAHYTGHGGYNTLGDGYMKLEELVSIANGNKLPFMVGATCTLAPYDQTHYNFCTAGLTYTEGGFIGTFASTREVYGNGNYQVTRPFVSALFAKDANGNPQTAGDAMKYAKREGPKTINSLKYHLLGDPALIIAKPTEGYAICDKVNNVNIEDMTEPITALSRNVLYGSVRRGNGEVDTQFNGTAIVKLYDKKSKLKTTGETSGIPFDYEDWQSCLFSGNVQVTNGKFDCEFMLPKEINYEVGYGRLRIFATSDDGRDVMGADERLLIGDMADGTGNDTIGPKITAWIDFPEFVNGQETSATPTLYAIISDPQGINLSGQGVGHDISLVIDGDRTNAIILNNMFTFDANSFTNGAIAYQLPTLSNGQHSITLKAWDNQNNSNAITMQVYAKSNSGIHFGNTSLSHSNGQTTISFSHDCTGSSMRVEVDIYSLTGLKVATVRTDMAPEGASKFKMDITEAMCHAMQLSQSTCIVRCRVKSDGREGSWTQVVNL